MTTALKLNLHDLDDGHDVATINDTLPEVYDTDNPMGAEVSMGDSSPDEYSVCVQERNNTAGWYYRAALCNLAMWQYKLGEGARKKEAAEAIERRRNELATELGQHSAHTYIGASGSMRRAIDMIIDLECKP